mgnify:CR=1 FL=1
MIKNVTNRASFLRLLAELRLCIYGYLLDSSIIPLHQDRLPFDVIVNMIILGLEHESSETCAAQTIVLQMEETFGPTMDLF